LCSLAGEVDVHFGVRGNYWILREGVTTQNFSFAHWVEKFTVGGSENGRPRSERPGLEREKLLGKIPQKSPKLAPLELGSSSTAVNRVTIVKPHHLFFPCRQSASHVAGGGTPWAIGICRRCAEKAGKETQFFHHETLHCPEVGSHSHLTSIS